VVSPSPTRSRLVCVVPNPSIDKTAVVDRLIDGTIHRPSEVLAVAGGKGLNVARAARALGVPVAAALLLAGRAGDWIDEELARLPVPHDAVRSAGETRTCLSVLDRSTGAMTEIYEPGPVVTEATWNRFLRLVRRSIRSSDAGSIVALSGSLPPGVDPAAAGAIVRASLTAGLTALVDTSGPALRSALAAGPTVVKVNASEAGELLGDVIDTERRAVAAAHELVRRGAATAIVTRGPDGAVAWDGTDAWTVEPPPGGGSHAVGAGDAFLAGLADGLRRQEPLNASLATAAGAAAASTLMPGPGNLDRRAARAMRRSVVVRRIA
jgi:1-phosphofructokinase family hexose kinase